MFANKIRILSIALITILLGFLTNCSNESSFGESPVVPNNPSNQNGTTISNPSNATKGSGSVNSDPNGCTPGTLPKPVPASLLVTADNMTSIALLGKGDITVTGLAAINSRSKMAGVIWGKGNIEAQQMNFVGNYVEIGVGKFIADSGNVQTGGAPVADYLANVPSPDISKLNIQSRIPLKISGNMALNPGIYQGGIYIRSNAKVSLAPGVYVFQNGGLSMADSASLSGSGVLLYHNGNIKPGDGHDGDCDGDDDDDRDAPSYIDGFIFASSGAVNLSPMTSGPQQGIVFFDRTSISFINLLCGANVSVTGTFYAPNSRLFALGQTDLNVQASFIVRRMVVAGDPNVRIGVDPTKTLPVCQ